MSETVNHYQPPVADVEPIASSSNQELASRGRRFGTLVVDLVGYVLLSFMVGFILAMVFGPIAIQAVLGQVPDFVFGWGVFFAYYCFFEGIWGRTPGKWLFGTMVIAETGGRPSFGQVLGRTACRFIPFEAFSFFGERGWHDKITRTRVVRV